MMKRISILLFCLAGLSACSTLERARSSFFGEEPAPDHSFLAYEESPYSRSLPKEERSRLDTLWELRQLEARLTPAENSQYQRIRPSLNSDRRRVEFLKQGSLRSKEAWALEQNLYLPEETPSEMIQAGEALRAGMSPAQVRELLGDPQRVEVSGSKRYGNERWVYADNRTYGSPRQTYFIYFEDGRVAGWQTTR